MTARCVAVLPLLAWPAIFAQANPCPSLPSNSFVLPSWLSSANMNGANYIETDDGIQIIDINGDSLPDIVWGMNFEVPNIFPTSGFFNCVYLNTQCGWVLQADYNGTDTSCLPGSSIIVEDVEYNFHGVKVSEFCAAVAADHGWSVQEVQVLSAAGVRQGGLNSLDALAAQPGGFRVSAKGKVYAFLRS
jgi:hypothetical protein